MSKSLLAFVALSLILNACQSGHTEAAWEPAPITQQDPAGRLKAEALCRRLSEIKIMPFGREEVRDEVYTGLAEAKEAAVPCLIDQLANTTPMHDPRREPTHSDFFTVGDAAFFTLIRIIDVPLVRVLPDEVMSRWHDEGLYAYFEYVQTKENRMALQSKWRAWYEEERKKIGETRRPHTR
jgi:hypothetical protein